MTIPAEAIVPSSTNSKGKNPLFVKDHDDIFIQKKSSSSSSDDSGSGNPADGVRTSVYKHFESNMYVLVCRTSSPIFTLNIYVPTAAPNNKGLPHTLEHLIFCGSKRYPIRGYIDTLASYNYSIIDYHHKYYDANNVTVVLTGAFSDDFEEKYLQTIPADIVQSRGSDSREPMDFSPPDNSHPRYETVRFPSSDTSTGSFSFGWQGPKHGDPETNLALDIMLEYLAGTSSSPLNLRFVERMLIGEFKQLIDTQFDGDKYALEKAAKRLSDKMASNIEEAPGDAMQEIFYPDIVASHFLPESQGIKKLHIGSLLRQFDIIADLSKRPVEFWIGLLKKWLIDGTVYHFALVPDTELGPKLDLERKKIEQANAAKFVDKEAHAMRIKKAVDASTAHVSEEVKKAMRAPDPTKTTILPHKQNLVVLDNAIGPVVAVQSINVDSGFAEAQIQIPIGNITDDQRSYLTLFQELLMGTDILLPAGVLFDNSNTPLQTEKRVRYSVFESRISDLVASRYSRFGQRLQLFSCTSRPGELLTNRRHMSFLAQEGVLKNVIDKAKNGKVDEVIGKLRNIQNMLIRATGGFIALSLPSSGTPKPYVDAFAREWNMC
ncbi:hypothetical protein GGI11_003532 [Coemansia sp. RSA 2049]|nr:hypothetical protein GGI11_003532 [Coemansia sp. RSA 2049]